MKDERSYLLVTTPPKVLVRSFTTKGFKVTDEAVEFLSSIKERVGVIAVAGKYRTGKSFLLNRVILNKLNGGFGVGPTINPCTKVIPYRVSVTGFMDLEPTH